jgi:hypothetical protein
MIPTAPIKATRINPCRLLMYGPPKVGKTKAVAALSMAPHAGYETLIVELEKGNADFVEGLITKVASLDELLKLVEEVRALNASKARHIRLAIDTLDVLEEWCEGDATLAYRKSGIGVNFKGESVLELPKGAGYLHLRTSFKSVLSIIEEACDEVIYIAHLREKLLGEEGKQVAAKDLDLTGKIRNIVCARANAIASVSRNAQSQLMADFRTSELVNCGGHCPHLAGKQLVLGEVGPDGGTKFYWDRIYLPTPGGAV